MAQGDRTHSATTPCARPSQRNLIIANSGQLSGSPASRCPVRRRAKVEFWPRRSAPAAVCGPVTR